MGKIRKSKSLMLSLFALVAFIGLGFSSVVSADTCGNLLSNSAIPSGGLAEQVGINISSSVDSLVAGNPVTITWSSQNATWGCGSNFGASGSNLYPTTGGITNYYVTCYQGDGLGNYYSATACVNIAVDNNCAASTCIPGTPSVPTSCWNGLATVNGTKYCPNSCAANTCTSGTCWDNYATVAGTKTTNECAAPVGFSFSRSADGAALTLNWNATPGATGYHLRIDNTADGFWPILATDTYLDNYVPISYSRAVLPGVAYNAWIHSVGPSGYSQAAASLSILDNCAPRTCDNTNCWNGVASIPGTKPSTYGPPVCTSTITDCSVDTCQQNITSKSYSCWQYDSTNCSGPIACDATANCPVNETTTCPLCPRSIIDWREVAP